MVYALPSTYFRVASLHCIYFADRVYHLHRQILVFIISALTDLYCDVFVFQGLHLLIFNLYLYGRRDNKHKKSTCIIYTINILKYKIFL